MDWETIKKLMDCFPNSFINYLGEVIVHRKSNIYFNIMNCKSELDIKCKVLEWLSRASFKTLPYRSERKNREFHKFMRDGVNKYLGTDFSEEDMELIYTYLGNAVHHDLTVRFVESGYDMAILKEGGF